MSSEALWAEHGLTGLVLLALFTLIGVFIHTLTKKDAKHTSFLETILADHREERSESTEATRHNAEKLSGAIEKLAEEIRDTRSDRIATMEKVLQRDLDALKRKTPT